MLSRQDFFRGARGAQRRLRTYGLVATGVLLALGGCGAEDDTAAELPTRSSTPSSEASPPAEPAADAALAAFRDAVRVTDEARQDPAARDWEPDIRRHLGDPAASLAVQAVRDYAALGLRQEGDSAVIAEVGTVELAAPEGPTVRITGCFDSTSRQVIDGATGQPVPPATPPTYTWDVTVTQFPAEAAQPWLVTVLEPRTDQPC